jgi:catecholate siderophore receptor
LPTVSPQQTVYHARVARDAFGFHILLERAWATRRLEHGMRQWLVRLSMLVLLCVPVPVADAQTAAASRAVGLVTDPSGAPIGGAIVAVISDGRTIAGPVRTDLNGEFQLALPPGQYSLTVAADGFGDVSRIFSVPVSRPHELDVAMALAGVHETVAVTAAPVAAIRSATKTPMPLLNVPQSITIVTERQIQDQLMMSIGDVMRYVPGVAVHQGENNRDQIIMRGNSTSADFFVDGVRDDVQYYRDLYNVSRVEVLKGPNALIFGRGGAGGVVNRVGKEAVFQPMYEVALQGGMYGHKRVTSDVDHPLGDKAALRVNGMFEDSNSFRDGVGLKRYGITPTFTFVPSGRTKIVASYEYLNDTRVADRGITSVLGRPVGVDPSTYFGNPADSHVDAAVNLGYVTVEHQAGAVTVRNHTSLAHYDRSYQNFVPGAVSANQQQFTMTAYNNATARTNLFNQTDLTYLASTGSIRHTVLVGAEVGRQLTDNFRNTGFFNNSTTSILVPLAAPAISTPVTFRQSATDADNHLTTGLGAMYAQDLVELNAHLQIVGGLRFDRFDLTYHDNRANNTLTRPDNLVSPRAGIVVKPITPLSVYSSYSVSYLPSSGDQFSSLTTITQQVEPEKFINYEVGVKWDVVPSLAVTTALYRLDRTNTRSTDPDDPTRIIQTGSQRTNGAEVGLNGQLTPAWAMAGGYAYQNAYVTSATTNAAAGAQVGQVPHHTLSLWNNYRMHRKVSAGLGLLCRSDMFVAVDNTVTLPAYTRVDAALFYAVTANSRLQINVENLLDASYYINADSNTNISPGSPRALRIALITRF